MSRYYSETKYNSSHEPIMTTLYYCRDINDTVVLLAVSGWKSHDNMMKLFSNYPRK